MKNRKREIRTSGSVRDEAGQPPHLLGRRQFLHLSAGAAALPAVSRIARAQTYPTRPVRIIVPFAAGGPTDIFARLIGQWLQERLGQPFVTENRPGGGTNIATESVVRAPPDGYTLLMVGPSSAVNATLYDKLNFVFLRDIAAVAGILRYAQVVVVHPSVPVKTIPQLIAYAKANPGRLNMVSSGVGAADHLAGELFKTMAGVDMIHVPYRGIAPALTDLIAGQAQICFPGTASSIEHIRNGTLRALAVTTTTRSELLPDLPTVSDFLAGYEASVWLGLGAPKGTPPEIIEKLNKEINAGLVASTIKARITDVGAFVLAGSAAEFGKLMAEDTEKWGKVIRAAHIKAE
jgi:tripartite-type tricarboxylate transporter receptor subunit TctC